MRKYKRLSIFILFFIYSHCTYSQWNNLVIPTTQFLFGEYFLNNDTGFVFGDYVVLKTTDGGANWSAPAVSLNSQFTAMTFVNDSIGFLVGDGGTILKTTDDGDNWIAQSPVPQLFYAVDFADSLHGIVVGDEASIRKTSDGGNTWISIQSPYLFNDSLFHYELRTVQYINDSVAYAAGGPNAGSTGILIKTTDGGNTWTTVFESYNFPIFLQIEFLNDTLGFASGSCHVNNPFCFRSKIIRTNDGGNSWSEIYFDLADELRSIDVIGNNIYSVGYYGGGSPVVVYSSDLGLNWNYQSTPPISYPYQVFFTDSLTGYIVGDSGKVLKTTNGGLGFSELLPPDYKATIFPNPNTGTFTIKCENAIQNRHLLIEVVDLAGKKIWSQKLPSQNNLDPINLIQIHSGLYLIKISNNQFSITEKLIIQK